MNIDFRLIADIVRWFPIALLALFPILELSLVVENYRYHRTPRSIFAAIINISASMCAPVVGLLFINAFCPGMLEETIMYVAFSLMGASVVFGGIHLCQSIHFWRNFARKHNTKRSQTRKSILAKGINGSKDSR